MVGMARGRRVVCKEMRLGRRERGLKYGVVDGFGGRGGVAE